MTDAHKPLDGHHALVTGAGSGIGAATALALARAGARVSLAGRRLAPLEDIARGMPEGSATVVDSFDVTSEGAVSGGVERARAAFGPGNHSRQQCGRSAERAVREDRSWPLVPHDRRQSEWRLSRLSRRSLRFESARRGRAAHQHRVDRGPRRLRLCRRLLRGEARPHWPHAGAGARIRQDRNHRQRRSAPASPRRPSLRALSKPLSRRPADRKRWPRLS